MWKKQAGTVNVTLWLCQNSYWTCTIEIVDLPIQNGDVPSFFLGLPGRVCHVPHPVTSPPKNAISLSRILNVDPSNFVNAVDPTLFWYDNCVISYVVSISYITFYYIYYMISWYPMIIDYASHSVPSYPYYISIMSIICLLSSKYIPIIYILLYPMITC